MYDEVSAAFELLAKNPAVGSRRYAYLFPDGLLRSWPLGKYPYLLFYLEQTDHLDVIRFLHGRRDIPVVLQEGEG